MRHPTLYQVNTRVLLRELGGRLGHPATLDDVGDRFIEEAAASGFEWIWPLGVWQTGEAARAVSKGSQEMKASFAHLLPDFREEDITGSPFAVQDYVVHKDFGGNAALGRFRERLAKKGLRLLLDFVPNHVAPDHPWASSHPEFFISGTEEDLAREPQNYARFQTESGARILAYGRDPYFSGWSDTLQLNYRHPSLRRAMRETLLSVSGLCDGVRCDMAMLVQPEIFQRTWGDRALPRDGAAPEDVPFWPGAIREVRALRPDFLFIAEVYWDMEWDLQQAGFDFTYDKKLYDRLRDGSARSVREHLMAAPDYQDRSLRFLENHDEPRASTVFPPEKHRAAAVTAFLVPGMRFFYEGQLDGRKVHVSMHVGRRPAEPADLPLREFYRRLLTVLRRPETHDGTWRLCQPSSAWEDNLTFDQFICGSWEAGESRLLVCVNFAPERGQCYVPVGFEELRGRMVELTDLLGDAHYLRQGEDLAGRGMYLDLSPWGFHVFELRSVSAPVERVAAAV